MKPIRSLSRWAGIGWAVPVAIVAGVAGWALHAVLSPPDDVLSASDYAVVRVQPGTVSHSIRLNTSVEWSAELVAPNQAAGTVTTVGWQSGKRAEPGDTLYTVDLRPVVVAEGDVPAFRDLSSGARGDDVAQLQRLLADLGYPVWAEDGVFGWALDSAVRSWQRDLGLTPDGVVRRGDVIFVPELPTRLSLDPELAVGTNLTGGEPAVQVLPPAPTFTIVLPEAQARLVTPGMPVEINYPGGTWSAEIGEVRRGTGSDGPGGMSAILTSEAGADICGDDCDEITIDAETLLDSTIHLVPETTGLTVPAAALATTAAGQTVVVLESGELQPVTVVTAARGMAVVEGVADGARVRIPGEVPGDAR